MIRVRRAIRRVEQMENSAADKGGVRFILLDEAALIGKGSKDAIAGYVSRVLADVAPEVLEAATLGKTMAAEVTKRA
jgi:hypothetical protein